MTIEQISDENDAAIWMECNWGFLSEENPHINQENLKNDLFSIELKHSRETSPSAIKEILEEIYVKLFRFVDSSYLRGKNTALKKKALTILGKKKKEVS